MNKFLDKFESYKDLDLNGVRLPTFEIDEKYYERLGLDLSTENDKFLRALCNQGFEERGLESAPNIQEYRDRLDRELSLFEELGYVDYILLIWDIINYAAESKIAVGLGRGSAAGSLALFLTGVTGVDPIKYDLLFERFVSRARSKSTVIDGVTYYDGSLLPDVDIDFEYTKRHKIIEYIQKKYEGKTCKILTVGTLQGKACIKESCKIAGGYNDIEATQVTARIEKTFGAVQHIDEAIEEGLKDWVEQPQREFQYMDNKGVAKIAQKLEGLPKNFGVHASAMGVSYSPLKDCCPLQLTKDGELVSSFTKNDAEQIMVKVDALGLKTLTIVDNISKKTGEDFREIDFESPEIYKKINEWKENLYGIFQFEGFTALKATNKVKPQSLEDLSAINALARPGSLSHIDEYAARKNEKKEFDEVHPELTKITKNTHGFLIYQEQIMQALNRVFGFTLERAETARRCVTGDTLFVSKARGYVSINTLLKDGYENDLFLVMDENGTQQWKPIQDIWSNGSKQVRYVEAANGMEVKASRWHQFLTDEGWKARNYLKENEDYLVCAKEVEYDGVDVISEDFAIVCSGLITEGYFVDGKCATFTNYDKCVMGRFESSLKREFGDDYTFNDTERKVLRLRKSVKDRVKKILPQGKSASKIIPEAMLGLTKETTRKFLSFIFACEGTVTETELSITSKSKKLISQIQLLLIRFGVRSNRVKKTTEGKAYWVLSINEWEYIVKFRDELSEELQNYKKIKLNSFINSREGNFTNTRNIIPSRLFGKFINQYGNLLSYESGQLYYSNISRRKFAKFAKKSKDPKWVKLSEGKHEYSLLKSTEKSIREVEVFDFTIDEETPFIVANGMVIHNCIGKKKPEEMKKLKPEIFKAGKEKGIINEVTERFWVDVQAASNYSFNKSHSMAYSMLAAQCAYFKWKYPELYFAEYLNLSKFASNADGGPQAEIGKIVEELGIFGIPIHHPDLLKSDMDFTVDDEGGIRYALSGIKGIAGKKIEALTEFRGEYPNKFEMFQAAKTSKLNIGDLSSLIQAGAMESSANDRCFTVLEAQVWNVLTDREKKFMMLYGERFDYKVFDLLKHFIDEKVTEDGGKKRIIADKRYETIKRHSEKYIKIWNLNKRYEDLASWFFERKLLGYSYTGSLFDLMSSEVKNLMDMGDFKYETDGTVCNYAGIVTDYYNKPSKSGKDMLRLQISDTNANMTVILFDKSYKKWVGNHLDEKGKPMFPKKESIVVVTGKKSGTTVFLDDIHLMDEKIYLKLSELKGGAKDRTGADEIPNPAPKPITKEEIEQKEDLVAEANFSGRSGGETAADTQGQTNGEHKNMTNKTTMKDHKSSIKEGKDAEVAFRKACEAEGTPITESTRDQNIYEHIDAFITLKSAPYGVDVKGPKRRDRGGNVSFDQTWVELKNVSGENGWLFGKADIIAFDRGDYFMMVMRGDLIGFMNKVVDVNGEAGESKSLYEIYGRAKWEKKDKMVWVDLNDLTKYLEAEDKRFKKLQKAA